MSDLLEWQNRARVVDELAQALRERIYRGVYAPGDALPQPQLAEQLGVDSRSLGEALRVLQAEGMVEPDAAHGVRVTRADGPRLLDAYVLREMLDGLAARLAAERSADQAHQLLDPIVARQRRAMQPWSAGDYTLANVSFHTTIVEMAKNEFLSGQLGIVRLTSQVFAPAVILAEPEAERAVLEHEGLIAAIARGDADEAERLGRSHIRSTITSLREQLSAHP